MNKRAIRVWYDFVAGCYRAERTPRDYSWEPSGSGETPSEAEADLDSTEVDFYD